MHKSWLRSAAVAMLAALVLVACGGGGGETPPGGSGEESAAENNFTLTTEGHLTVGSDIPYPPFEFEKGGALTGFDVDLVREIASRIGLENTDDDWISTDFDTIFQQLQSGTNFDIIVAAVTAYAPEGSPAGDTVADRKKLVDFTHAYYPSLQSLVVDTTKSDVKSIDEVPDGTRVGVQAATTGAFFAKDVLPNAEIVEFPKAPDMFQALQAGQIEALVNDLPVSEAEIKNKPNLEIVEQLETGEEYGIGVSKENTELKDAIDAALQEMFDDGTYADIYLKYFPEAELPSYASE